MAWSGCWTRRLASGVILCLAPAVTKADVLDLGVLSFNTFIPGSAASPGSNAFNISNFSGSFTLPPDFPVVDDLFFQSASLTLFQTGGTSNKISLGDIGPGFAFDTFGNPLVQVPGDETFTSAEFLATLIPLTFGLADGNPFVVGLSTIDIVLSPSGGTALTADVDLVPISVAGTELTPASTPEPASVLLLLTVIASFALMLRSKQA